VIADPEIDALFPQVKRARVTITTTSGESHTVQTDIAKGAPDDPLTDDELIAKFRANAEGVLTSAQQDAAIETTLHFEDVTDLSQYMGLFVVAS
jgi:2-methylcitrate dehydratase